MQFRCPNCQHAIKIEQAEFSHEDETLNSVKCPSCHSQFNLSTDEETTVAASRGQKIGHFEILDVLGEGAFGTVYLAQDPELNRRVAIKIPRAGRIGPKTSKLFLREAQSAARIQHPHLVRIYEVGIHQEHYYIVSEYIDGVSLSDWLKQHPTNSKQSSELLIKILRAAQAFHSAGIVHRDLKPANILMGPDDQPFVTDFGLARHESENVITVTQAGDVFGTPIYMSPEQARGDNQLVDQRSDVYAIGVILYQMLTGEKPFRSSSSHTLLQNIQNLDPRRPRQVNSRVPRELESICLKAIEKKAEDRYQSADEMADDLQRFLDGRPVVAKPAGPVKRLRKWAGRHRAGVAAGFVVFLSAAVALGAILTRGPEIPDNMTQVVIETDPPASEIRFVRCDESLRVPDVSGFEQVTVSGQEVWLKAGLYRVVARDESGAFHEVWRTVPEQSKVDDNTSAFPHLYSWTDDEGRVRLPSFSLFSEKDLAIPLLLVKGGSFQMGTDPVAGMQAAQHRQEVRDFRVGINEVTFGQFREVMKAAAPPQRPEKTWLEYLQRDFGDRSAIDDKMPVTGYSRDVAILFCELAGGRLPTCVEYEYAATNGGKDQYPTGDAAAVDAEDAWGVRAVGEPTPDQSALGLQNLYFSVAEFTDSASQSYAQLFPEAFPNKRGAGSFVLPSGLGTRIAAGMDVRGVPGWWMRGEQGEKPGTPASRLIVPEVFGPPETYQQTYGRIGFRIYRSDQPQMGPGE